MKIKALINFEIKKVLNIKKAIVLSCLTIMVLGVLFVFSLKTTDIYTRNGSVLDIIQQIQYKRQNMTKLSDNLTDEALQKSVKEFQNIVRDDKNIDSNGNLVIQSSEQMNSFNINSDLAYLVVRTYSPLYTFDPSVLDSINIDTIKIDDIQTNRLLRLKEINPDYQENVNKDKNFKSGYSLGWQTLLNDLSYIQIFVMIICAIFSTSFFDIEKKSKVDPLLKTSSLSPENLHGVKLISCISTVTMYYWLVILLYTLLKLSVYGFEGSNLMIQTSYLFWLSSMTITFAQAFIINALVGYLAILFISVLSLLLSKVINKKYISDLFVLIFIFFPLMLNNYPQICIFPTNVIQLSGNILNFNWICAIHYIYILPLIMIFGILIMIFFILKERKV